MPRRTDIHKILVLGSGPIVIGQACEFDYSGTQAVKALREEGFQVVLVNSNPATIMTDPELANATYIEPLTPETVERIIGMEKPDALLPTMGGQTAINLAVALAKSGALERHGVRLIGANLLAMETAEDRRLFKGAMNEIGLATPPSGVARSLEEAMRLARELAFPVVVRPSFTMGGAGGGLAYNIEEFEAVAAGGLAASPIHEVLVEKALMGWKEFELEVMRDLADNVVIICSIENLDPMGVHTGDSVTVAPAQTLTDREYQRMRDAAIKVIRRIGVETGGSNIQFAVNPENGDMVVIEMNPRVSRSSALASKATGFPIAKIAAKLAVGFTLDEIRNDITRETPSSFEPTLDYVVVKVPRFAFEKFAGTDPELGVQMKSVGEVMALGRTFPEALGKAMRSMETGTPGLSAFRKIHPRRVREKLLTPNPERLYYLHHALKEGMSVEEAARLSKVDLWFLRHLASFASLEREIRAASFENASGELLARAKRHGFSDRELAAFWKDSGNGSGAAEPKAPGFWDVSEADVRRRRKEMKVEPVFKRVDTCAAEFEALTPYLYSAYESECEAAPTSRRKVMILGSGPNRIGQGIEFDYCCCHASFALREEGFETIMVNCNPETVSTDYDTSDRLYFEPLTLEDVLRVVEVEKPEGIIVQYGGQTPLNLAKALAAEGVPILGTSPESIDAAEDREKFNTLLASLKIRVPRHAMASSREDALRAAQNIGYPVLVRPSYVLGGRAMAVVYDEEALLSYMEHAVEVSPGRPVLVDEFLEDAFELDVDALADGRNVVVAGIMQHIEEAGIHSGDSACVLPPFKVPHAMLDEIRAITEKIGKSLGVVGLLNIQFAVREGKVYVLEANPRASRTVPFVSKAVGLPLAKMGARLMVGRTLKELGLTREPRPHGFCVKAPVLPFARFPKFDPVLGPEMRSTGEVMGIADSFGEAFAKAQLAAGTRLPLSGTLFISVHDSDKPEVVPLARGFHQLGFRLVATRGTAEVLGRAGLSCEPLNKVNEGRPNAVDYVKNGRIQLVVNTPMGRESYYDDAAIRRSAIRHGIPCITTLSGAAAALEAVCALADGALRYRSLQGWHGGDAVARRSKSV
jgi:carbamoyl-phosphate synthase large subunit